MDKRQQKRFNTLGFYSNTKMDFLNEFSEYPLCDFDKEGMLSGLLVKMLETHFKMKIRPSEAVVLLHIASGLSIDETCKRLDIKPTTYSKHRDRLRNHFINAGFVQEKFNTTAIMALVTNRVMGQLI